MYCLVSLNFCARRCAMIILNLYVKFEKLSKTVFVLIVGVTISGTPCPRHITVPWICLDRPWIISGLMFFCIDHGFFSGSTMDFSRSAMIFFWNDHGIFLGLTKEFYCIDFEFFLDRLWIFSGSTMDFFWVDHRFYLNRP